MHALTALSARFRVIMFVVVVATIFAVGALAHPGRDGSMGSNGHVQLLDQRVREVQERQAAYLTARHEAAFLQQYRVLRANARAYAAAHSTASSS
jgi:hypothetical protein